MQLTPEKLEKAAKAARSSWYPKLSEEQLEDGFTANREDWLTAVTAAFATVEPPQVDVPVDLVERCARTFDRRYDAYCGLSTVACMTAALRVALEDPRVLGEPTFDEFHQAQKDKYAVASTNATEVAKCSDLLASRRARLLVPQETSEQLAVKEILEKYGVWHGDGLRKAQTDLVGLIAKMKAESTVSGEAGGNAQ